MQRSARTAADPATVKARVEEIVNQYLATLPPDYASRYSLLADQDTLLMLLRATRSGLKPSAVCEAASINPRTLQRWHEQADADPTSPQAAFVSLLKAARRQGQIARLEKIEAHGDREWTALAWLNERTDQEQFALQRDKGNDGPAVHVEFNGIKYVVQTSQDGNALIGPQGNAVDGVVVETPKALGE